MRVLIKGHTISDFLHRVFQFCFCLPFRILFPYVLSDVTSAQSYTEIKVLTETLNKMFFFTLLHIVAFLVINVTAQSSQQCPALFLRYTQIHSYCKAVNPTCNVLRSSVTKADIKVILSEHNTYRSNIAMGKENNLPSAANMLEMVWDDELAAVAQKHAAQCLFEHDCGSCRRVQNFGVGQNLAIETVSNSANIPDPNWPSAIKSWYDEIAYFKNLAAIDSFISPPPDPTYGHFSQLIWAGSWRIGCGYVLYREDNVYQKLYACNYGSAGNTIEKSMYKKGSPCSACPINSCCDATCGAIAHYAGLCKITDNKAPKFKPERKYMFYCDFDNQSDCDGFVKGPNKWLIYKTLSGNYLGIVLNGGETSTMVFKNKMKPNLTKLPSVTHFCFVITYRKGPNVAGHVEDNTASETFTITEDNYDVLQKLPNFGGDFQQQFNEFSMSLGWNKETEYKITFSVPAGRPPQFLEIQSLYATNGSCKQ